MSTRFRKQLPPNCHIDKGFYVRFQKQIKGVKYNYQVGTTRQSIDQIWSSYQSIIRIIENKPDKNTLLWLSGKFQQSPKFKGLSKNTQPRYLVAARILDHGLKINNIESKLGMLLLTDISKPFIQELMQKRLEQYKASGKKGESAVNYEVAYLSSMVTWGLNFVSGLPIAVNPLIGIEMLKAPKNTRYVTHAEYSSQLNQASSLLQAFFEVAYLCACRSIEVRNLRESDDLGDKLLIKRTKGSKHTYITITSRLRLAIDKAKSLRPRAKITILNDDKFIFTNQSGYEIKAEGLKSAMSRLKKKVGDDFWSMHLLKSKGISDSKDKDIAGLTESMKKRYNTKIETHEAVD